MKSDKERGEFGAWLRAERTARFENVPEAVRTVQRQMGYGIAPSVWAELESGTRRPSKEQRERLTGFFGSEPARAASEPAGADLSALIAALDRQTAAIGELVQVVRADREKLSPEGVRAFLRTLVAEGLVVPPESLPAEVDNNAGSHPQEVGP